MHFKLFILFIVANFGCCSIKTLEKSKSVESLLQNSKDNSLFKELYGVRKDRFLRNQDMNKDELHEDQDNSDVYKGMVFAKLGQDTLDFHQDVKKLEKNLEGFRKHTEMKLIPSEILSAANNVYIANSKFLVERQKLHKLKKERLLEGQSRDEFVKKIKKSQRERELQDIIAKAQNTQQKISLQKQTTPESLDFDLDDIYNISQEDMKKFAKGLFKK